MTEVEGERQSRFEASGYEEFFLSSTKILLFIFPMASLVYLLLGFCVGYGNSPFFEWGRIVIELRYLSVPIGVFFPLLILALIMYWALGRGLADRRRWSRILAIVLGCLHIYVWFSLAHVLSAEGFRRIAIVIASGMGVWYSMTVLYLIHPKAARFFRD